jgi:phage gpG-like protein
MPDIKIEIDDKAVREAFNQLIALGHDPEQELHAIGRVLKANIQRGFRESHDPYGKAWEPLKARQGQPLVNDGHLMNSIDYQVEGNSVEVGTNKVQGALQNFGGTITAKNGGSLFFMVGKQRVFVKSVTIPARPFIPTVSLPDDWRDDVLDILRDALQNAAGTT